MTKPTGVKQRLLKESTQELNSALSMLGDVSEPPTEDDIQSIRNAATQAQQAVTSLRILEGIIRGTTLFDN